MNKKKLISYALCAIGVFMMAYGLYSRSNMSTAEVKIHEMTQSKNSLVKKMGKQMESKVSSYGTKVRFFLYAGALLIVVGGAGVVLTWKHRKSK